MATSIPQGIVGGQFPASLTAAAQPNPNGSYTITSGTNYGWIEFNTNFVGSDGESIGESTLRAQTIMGKEGTLDVIMTFQPEHDITALEALKIQRLLTVKTGTFFNPLAYARKENLVRHFNLALV